MTFIDTKSPLWQYLSTTQQDLIEEGDYLLNNVIRHHQHQFKDYSYLVFPYAKAYEGFLKQLFLDLHFISHLDYISDHFRLGKFLSPHLVERLADRSLYLQIKQYDSPVIAEKIWQTWKLGRNQIFHYYPHNTKAISLEEAENIIAVILETMQTAYNLKDLKQANLTQKVPLNWEEHEERDII